jgi:hypothetical protein
VNDDILISVDRALAAGLSVDDVAPDSIEQLALMLRDNAPSARPEFTATLDDRVAHGFEPEPAAEPIWFWEPLVHRLKRAVAQHRIAQVATGFAATVAVVAIVLTATAPSTHRARPEDPLALGARDYVAAPSDETGATSARSKATDAATSGAAGGGHSITTASATVQDFRRYLLGSGLFLRVEPTDVPDVIARATHVATDLGGYPGSSTFDVKSSSATGSADLWVPTKRYPDAVARLSKLGHVERITEQSRDVTASHADLAEQIREDARQLAMYDAHRDDLDTYGRQQREALANQLDLRRQRIANLEKREELTLIDVKVRGVHTPHVYHRWTLDWATHESRLLLGRIGALLLVAAAVLALPALLLLAGWVAFAARRRSRRRSVLDDD